MRLRTAPVRMSVAGLVIVVLAGCTTRVSGHGQPASSTESAPRFSATTDPTTATTPVATSSAPTASPSASVSASSATTSAPKPANTTASRGQLNAQLSRLAPGQGRALVTVPGAVEAVTYDQTGRLTFWRYTSTWARAGTSTYPYDATLGPPTATAIGTRLTGMAHATFIVNGLFSEDSSVNAAAYTTGADGWGAIKAEKDGNIGPSGQGIDFSGIGLANDFGFVGGLLMTADCSKTLPFAECGGSKRVLKYWRWSGHDFVLDHSAGLSR